MTLAALGETLAAYSTKGYDQARAMPGAFYTDEALTEVELDVLFANEWVCVGREEEVANPGDYLTFQIADEPIVVIRGLDGETRALSNVCRHRATVIAQGTGNAKTLTCPYHAWAYDTTGALLRAPHITEREDFVVADCRLPQFATEVWLGFVFVSLSQQPTPLGERLEPLRQTIEAYHFEQMHLGYLTEWTWDTNWKCLFENFMEGYHLSPLHYDTLHKLNPTRLCEHISPGDGYFGYKVGFAERVDGASGGHSDLSDEQRTSCIMLALPPGLAIGGAGDYSSFLCIAPDTAHRVRMKAGLIFHGENWPQAATQQAIDVFEETMEEDRRVLVEMRRGQRSRHYVPGPLGPPAFEGPIWDFYHYLNGKLGDSLTD
jgi:phenylpropionate dioxygenase-like ring-hydroxylating dioxygenase large terminal subunit